MYYETVTSVTSVTSVFEVFLVEGIFFFLNFLEKKNWNIGIGENACRYVTLATYFKIVMSNSYEKISTKYAYKV